VPAGIRTGGFGVGAPGHWITVEKGSVAPNAAAPFRTQYQWLSDEIPFVCYDSFTRYHRLAARYTYVVASSTPKYEQPGIIAKSADDVYESIGTLSPVALDMNWEASSGLAPVDTAIWEALGGIVKTKVGKYEQVGAISQTGVDVYEAAGLVAQTQADVYEALQGILPTVIAAWEAVGGIVKSNITKYEQLGAISQTQADVWEAVGRIAQTQVDVWEALTGALLGQSDVYESLGGIVQTKTPKYEQLAQLAVTQIDVWEALGRIAQTQVDLWEALQGVLPGDVAVWEAIGGVVVTKLVKYEQLALLAQTQIDALEALGLVPTNLMENPTVEVNLLCWNGTKGTETLTRDNAQALDGSWSAKVITINQDGSGFYWRKADTTRIPATPRTKYKMQVDVFATGGAIGQPFYPSFQFLDAAQVDAGGSSAGPIINLVAGWQRFTLVSNEAPSAAAFVSPSVRQNGAIGTITIWADNGLLIPQPSDEVWEAGLGLSQAVVSIWEALGGIVKAQLAKYEQLGRAQQTTLMPWEATQLLASSQVDVYEALLGLLPSAVVPWEAFAIINTGNAAAIFWESIGNVLTSVDIFWDSCATFEGEIAASGSYGVEAASAVIGTVEAPIATSYASDQPGATVFTQDLPSGGSFVNDSPTSPPCRDDV